MWWWHQEILFCQKKNVLSCCSGSGFMGHQICQSRKPKKWMPGQWFPPYPIASPTGDCVFIWWKKSSFSFGHSHPHAIQIQKSSIYSVYNTFFSCQISGHSIDNPWIKYRSPGQVKSVAVKMHQSHHTDLSRMGTICYKKLTKPKINLINPNRTTCAKYLLTPDKIIARNTQIKVKP
jgi:hypothetical protein